MYGKGDLTSSRLLSRRSRRLRQLRRAHSDAATEQFFTELDEAWKGRRHAEVWRLARALAGKRSGPRKRQFDAAQARAPR
eukprot:9466888-Pyramimonas_sp.AAC.1